MILNGKERIILKRMVYNYKIYGMHLVSDFEFVQLIEIPEENAGYLESIAIVEGIIPDEYKKDKVCYSHIDKKVSYLSNKTCYLLVEDGERITYEKKQGANLANLNAYLLGWGLAMLFYQREKLAIHCACVANKDGAIMICGKSGGGKSTMTSLFLERGYSLVADDMAIVEYKEDGLVYAAPAFPYQKLCRDAAVQNGFVPEELIYIDENKDKFLVPYRGTFKTDPIPIRAMINIAFSEEGGIECGEIQGIEKLSACIESLFLKVLFKGNLYSRENVEKCLQLASAVPIYYLRRTHKHDARECMNAILRKIAE